MKSDKDRRWPHVIATAFMTLGGCGSGAETRAPPTTPGIGVKPHGTDPPPTMPTTVTNAPGPEAPRSLSFAGRSCEQLTFDYATYGFGTRLSCDSNDECRCSPGGIADRFCGGVDHRSTAFGLLQIREAFVAAGCREPRCGDGVPCSQKVCGSWRCQAVCREHNCANALGPDEH